MRVIAAKEHDRLAHGEGGRHTGLLQHDAALATRPAVARVVAEQPHLPKGWATKAQHDADGRRLPRTIRPEQRHYLPHGDREAHIAQGVHRAKRLRDSLKLDSRDQ